MDMLLILTRMKSLITLLILLPLPAWAQGVATFTVQTNVGLEFNGSFTDSSITFEGDGVNLTSIGGGASCSDFCFGDPILPGSSLNPSVGLDYGLGIAGTVTVGGHQIDCQQGSNCSLSGVGLTALSTVKFPTNDQNFTVTVPAIIGPQPIVGQLEQQSLPFNLQTAPGELVLTFDFFNAPSPAYQFEGAVFSSSGAVSTPEPGTLDLMLAAVLAGILGVVLKSRKPSVSMTRETLLAMWMMAALDQAVIDSRRTANGP